uniref:Secreted protein n=1 Tax=Trichogramma kaykai TaxID=54128 RepID=A0ABD2X1D5_9HYME
MTSIIHFLYGQSRLLIHPLQSARGKRLHTGARRGSSTWSSCSRVFKSVTWVSNSFFFGKPVEATRRTESVNIIYTRSRATQLTGFLYKIFISAAVAATSAAARTRVAEHNKERKTPLSHSSSTVIRNYTRAWACVVLCTRERPPKNASARR